MASTSTTAAASLGPPPSEKLTRDNYLLWKAQVLPALHGAQMTGLLDGTEPAPVATIPITKEDKTLGTAPNPASAAWLVRDQQVLSYLLTSLSKEVLTQVVSMEHAGDLWTAIGAMFSSQSRSRATNLRIALANTKKNNMSAANYVSKMKGLGDELAAAGRPLDEEEMVEYMLAGLDLEYNPLVASINAQPTITVSEFYAQLAAYDLRQEMLMVGSNRGQFQSTANAASRGRGAYTPRGRGNRGRGNRPGNGGGKGGRNYPYNSGRGRGRGRGQSTPRRDVTCQICKIQGHPANECWWHYDDEDSYEEKGANSVAVNSYGVDTNWYTDTGATDHITGELEKMTVREKYKGHDQVHTANGQGSGHEENYS